jgi:hypothetical protein
VVLRAHATVTRVAIEVEDRCGAAQPKEPWRPEQRAADRRSSDHALSTLAAEAAGGRLRQRNAPGAGCVFSIELPRQ